MYREYGLFYLLVKIHVYYTFNCAWQNSKPVSCKCVSPKLKLFRIAIQLFCMNLDISKLYTKMQPYIFQMLGLRFLQSTGIEKPNYLVTVIIYSFQKLRLICSYPSIRFCYLHVQKMFGLRPSIQTDCFIHRNAPVFSGMLLD